MMTPFEQALRLLKDCIAAGNKILICGNGGSATQAQHLAAELVVRYKKDRPAIAAIALTADSAVLTAAANDLGYQCVFSRQVEALGKFGDVLIALSTSGRSPNVLKAIREAHARNMGVIGLSGFDHMSAECTVDLFVLSKDTAYVQQKHLEIIHNLCEALGA